MWKPAIFNIYGAEGVEGKWTLLHCVYYNGLPKSKGLPLKKGVDPEYLKATGEPDVIVQSPFKGRCYRYWCIPVGVPREQYLRDIQVII